MKYIEYESSSLGGSISNSLEVYVMMINIFLKGQPTKPWVISHLQKGYSSDLRLFGHNVFCNIYTWRLEHHHVSCAIYGKQTINKMQVKLDPTAGELSMEVHLVLIFPIMCSRDILLQYAYFGSCHRLLSGLKTSKINRNLWHSSSPPSAKLCHIPREWENINATDKDLHNAGEWFTLFLCLPTCSYKN